MLSFIIGLAIGVAVRHYWPEIRSQYYAFKAKRK